ncbi:aldehyde dehydrogenase family protein, partial [Peribacillus tepidiphilus]|uniref:aldehyde dehydrogenase family protein n=1 Tax=Peribacillus tepidiphilus TaxID=2652445 RepID=UPI0035B53D62
PNIVFADCNEEKALEWVLRSIVQNAGQTCSAGSRLVIEKSIKETFVPKLAAAMEKLTIGPGIDNHDLGPVLSKKQFERIQSFIDTAKADGIHIVTGGERAFVENCEYGYLGKSENEKPSLMYILRTFRLIENACHKIFREVISRMKTG